MRIRNAGKSAARFSTILDFDFVLLHQTLLEPIYIFGVYVGFSFFLNMGVFIVCKFFLCLVSVVVTQLGILQCEI